MSGEIRGFRFRFYPTLKQRRYLSRAFGIGRFVWNWALSAKRGAYQERKESIGLSQLSRMLTALRNEKPWMKEIDRQVQGQSLRDLDRAYQNFFAKRAKFPRFKSRHGEQSVRFAFDHRHTGKSSAWAKRAIVLPGVGECRIADSLSEWPTLPSMVTVRRDACGDYWLSFAVESMNTVVAAEHMIGVDVGITDLAVTSDGWKSGQLVGLREKAATLKRYQRRVSRRVKGSNRRRDAKVRLARLHRKIANARKDFAHKVSDRITKSANVIVLETLNVAGMLKNHSLARSLSDAAMSELHRQIQYKAARRGGTVIRVDRWAPTSKVCSGCGHHVGEMPLSVRSWTCTECGSEHDRDVNAARNLLALGRGTALTRGDKRGSESAQAGSVLLVEPRISAVTRRRMDRQRVA
jgi:putative transposase